jgi:AcrR family transcriptional regulator
MGSTPEPENQEEAATARIEPPWWRPARPGRRRQPLTRDQIVDAAVRILDADGVDALTVRRLGEELNTGSATLYWYIASKDELAELVFDHVVGEIELPEPDPAQWQEQLKELGRGYYRMMLRHNDLVRLSLGHIPIGPNSMRMIEWSLTLLRGAGVPDQAAAYAGDIFGRYLDASVLEGTMSGGPPPEKVGEYFASLPPEEFPNVTGLTGALFEGDDMSRFEFGLDVLLRGLAAYVDDEKN